MNSLDLLFLLAIGVIAVSGYFAKRIMIPKDQAPSASASRTFRRADLIEQEQRLEALGVMLADPARQPDHDKG
jgi:hypothetical protein